jgi:hypothetical protein
MIFSIQDLTPYQWVHGIFTVIFVIISILIGLQILLKYYTAEGERFFEFIPLGLTYIFLSSAWWGPTFNFLVFVSTGIPLPEIVFIILNNAFLPLAIVCWIYAYSSLQEISWRKELRIVYLIISISWEILFFILTIFSMDTLYTFNYSDAGIYYSKRRLIALIFPIIALATALITGIHFGQGGIKSEDKTIKWKGIFLILTFVLFVGVALLDAILPRKVYILVILRLILILSGFCYYLGFFMPDWIKKFLIK